MTVAMLILAQAKCRRNIKEKETQQTRSIGKVKAVLKSRFFCDCPRRSAIAQRLKAIRLPANSTADAQTECEHTARYFHHSCTNDNKQLNTVVRVHKFQPTLQVESAPAQQAQRLPSFVQSVVAADSWMLDLQY
jgi:hypothetical protein